MADPKAVTNLEALEEHLQAMKWTLLRITPRSLRRKNGARGGIVHATAGLLGRTFPRGVIYERRLRRTWASRLRRLGP